MEGRWSVCVICFFGLLFIQFCACQEYCGMKEPVADKLCVSLRLPWQFEPIYFCTDNGKLNYRQRCKSSGQYCAAQPENTLQISTPWDCCPISSQPDPCGNAKCPPAPFNRTCSEYYSDNYWDCCPHYYCDGGSREMCHIKKLEPGCTTPTKDKEHCTGFIDPHGCCNKYQCKEDEKPGQCPSNKLQAQRLDAFRRGALVNITTIDGIKAYNSTVGPPSVSPSMFPPPSYTVVSFGTLQQCTGDYTCPNQMKCCSTGDYSLSFAEPLGRPVPPGKRVFYRKQFSIVHGYCMEPVFPSKS